MHGKTFIATTGSGIARATEGDRGEWRVETLLLGSDVRCLSVDPLYEGRIYAGTQGAGVLRSDDGGTTWRSSGLDGQVVKALAASPLRRGVVYAGTKPARMFVSRDGGDNWDELTAFRRIPLRWLWLSPAELPFTGYVQAIALSPTDPYRIVVGIEAGATVLSWDGGKSWTRHRAGALRDCHSLIFHSTRGEWLYEVGGGIMGRGGSAFSRNAGRTWSSVSRGLDRHYGWAVAADPVRPEVWYLSASPGAFKAHSEKRAQASIFRSDGEKWQRLGGGLPEPLDHMPYALLTDAGAPGHIYTSLSNGDIWHSSDHGEHWRQLPMSMGRIERAVAML
jgi:hypothetical protein